MLDTRIFLSTDAFEAEALIENNPPCVQNKYGYRDLDLNESLVISAEIKRSLGMAFNPMSVVDFGKGYSIRLFNEVMGKLVKEGLYVFWKDERDGWRREIPSDDDLREKLLRLALRKDWAEYCRSNEQDFVRMIGLSNKLGELGR